MNVDFVGREKEKKELNSYYDSNQNEFIAVYGRRRVGKTYLIKKTLDERIDFLFTGLYKEKLSVQLDYFYSELLKRQPQSKIKKPKSWKNAFELLFDYLNSLTNDKVVVFLDELPWMDVPKSNFLSALSNFWNMWNSKKILKLYVCGSSTSWMLNKLIGDKGGLYGRIGRSIYLAPFSLKETKEYLNYVKNANYTNYQVLDLYMIMGGIPYYLNMIDASIPISTNIDNLFFKSNAPLRLEYDFLFRSLFKTTTNYKKVVEVLSKKLVGLTREEIISASKISGGQLTELLNNLRACDFIRCYSSINKKEKEKIYQLIDPFILFHLKFINNDDGGNEYFWTNNQGKPIINTWQGYAYEIVILNHLNELKGILSILGINSRAYSWKVLPHVDKNGTKWNGAQIDLIIDRDDNVINLIEIKHSNSEYIITKEYYDKLLERIDNFKNSTKTKKSIVNTFITTRGIKQNNYSNIANIKIELDDFFR